MAKQTRVRIHNVFIFAYQKSAFLKINGRKIAKSPEIQKKLSANNYNVYLQMRQLLDLAETQEVPWISATGSWLVVSEDFFPTQAGRKFGISPHFWGWMKGVRHPFSKFEWMPRFFFLSLKKKISVGKGGREKQTERAWGSRRAGKSDVFAT